MPSIPNPAVAGGYLKDAFIIGIVAFTQSVSMAKILARKNNYSINPNQVLAYTIIHVTPHKHELNVYHWYLISKKLLLNSSYMIIIRMFRLNHILM